MWEYNQIRGSARSGVLMHRDHKYIDKYRDAKGNWQYVYETTKKGAKIIADKAGPAIRNRAADIKQTVKDAKANGYGYGQVSNNLSNQIGNIPKNVSNQKAAQKQAATAAANAKEKDQRARTQQTYKSTQQAIKEDKAKRENQSAKNEIKGSLLAMKSYENIYKMVKNASDFPVNYKDPKSGRTVTISDERRKGMALKQISGNMDSMSQDINKSLASMNPDDPEMARYAQATQAYLGQYKKNLASSEFPSKPTRRA